VEFPRNRGPGVNLTADLQGVNNPAYDPDLSPVAVFAVRVHFAC
jgi:hypothetical protein